MSAFKKVFYIKLNSFIDLLRSLKSKKYKHKLLFYKASIKLMNSINSNIVINNFYLYVKDYKDEITNENEDFFLKNNYSKELEGADKDDINLNDIFDIKNIWKKLNNEQKSAIFKDMKVLLKICEKYYEQKKKMKMLIIKK